MKTAKSKQPRSTTSRPSAPLKSSPPTKTAVRPWRKLAIVAAYLLLFVVATYVFYRRYPNNYTQPNFYAEDGQNFARNLIGKGLLGSLGATFNGYYIWGIYLVEKLGFVIDHLFYGGQFADLPRSLALASYMFLGFVTTLPALIFRNYLRPMALVIMTLLIAFVPMLGWDYAVIGTIGNLKFAFVFIAFMLLVYRHLMPENSKKVYLVDAALLVCAYTNITVYILMLFALLRYLPKLRGGDFIKRLLRDRTFQSLVVLGIALLPQLLVIKARGVPALPGYLDSPYQFGRTIQIFVSRSYLYGVLFPLNKYLNDALVVIIGLATLVGGFYASRKTRAIFLFGVLAVFVTTFTFVIKRTGVSAFYPNYHSGGGPDQFFYTQNWIFDFVLSIAAVEIIARFRSSARFLTYAVILLVMVFVLIPHAGTYGSSDSTAGAVGTIYAVGKQDCDSKAKVFNLSIYPSFNLFYTGVTRQQLCTKDVVNYHPQEVSLGLAPYNNDYLAGLGLSNRFRQTFVSPQANLDGVGVYFSTFGAKVHSPYKFTLLSGDCRTTLRSVAMATSKIHDNALYTVKFPVINGSHGQTYCFTVNSDSRGQVDPLAVQLSPSGQYPAGQATINNKPSSQDIVFDLHYK